MKQFLSILFLFIITGAQSGAQIISLNPVFATAEDTVVITYDATQGNAALVNLGPPVVYAHTGVITDKSTSDGDWRYVQGNWGKDDAKVKMTYAGQNRYQIKFHIRSFYGVPQGENIKKLAFVFRNSDGSKVGRSSNGTDIYVSLFNSGTYVTFKKPFNDKSIFNVNDSADVEILASESGLIEFFNNDILIDSVRGDALNHVLHFNTKGNGKLIAKLTTVSTMVADTFDYVVNNDLNIVDLPAGTKDGINYISDTKVRLSLYAPNKNFVYVIGDFNNWEANALYYMNKTSDGNRWWIEIDNLEKNREYGFQYWVDGSIKIADPYATKVLDQWNDGYIPVSTYPGLKAYPAAKTTGIVGILHPGKPAYSWAKINFQRPAREILNIYELHIRDFIAARNYKTLADTLHYLKQLGINAIQLMPINEFEGNSSWGYNPSFHMALDKYYGTENDCKAFIDLCHQNGIAVILDVVFNHAFSQNSLCQLYWDAGNSQPAADNPWLNPTAKHPFNVGYDFNHESAATQLYMDQILAYWVKEFHVDGFRFDLSKGFTQKNTGSDVGAWGAYDQSRINLLNRMKNELSATDNNLYLILEHFAENSEETTLSNSGFMLWGNMNNAYIEGSMGYASDFTWGSYKNRGWNSPNLVTYMESHDEERMMYKNLQFGNSNGTYNIKTPATALNRIELAANFLFCIPGPKMIWQFGELGYDVSIETNGRIGEKPYKWNYYSDADRRDVYRVFSDLMNLRKNYTVFSTGNFEMYTSGAGKTIKLNSSDMNVLLMGNFNVKSMDMAANFQNTGWWYEFYSGDSINVTNTGMNINMQAGEYRLYSTKKMNRLKNPFLGTASITNEAKTSIYPNPFTSEITINLAENAAQIKVSVLDFTGKLISHKTSSGNMVNIPQLDALPIGLYTVKIETENTSVTRKLYKQ